MLDPNVEGDGIIERVRSFRGRRIARGAAAATREGRGAAPAPISWSKRPGRNSSTEARSSRRIRPASSRCSRRVRWQRRRPRDHHGTGARDVALPAFLFAIGGITHSAARPAAPTRCATSRDSSRCRQRSLRRQSAGHPRRPAQEHARCIQGSRVSNHCHRHHDGAVISFRSPRCTLVEKRKPCALYLVDVGVWSSSWRRASPGQQGEPASPSGKRTGHRPGPAALQVPARAATA